VVRAKGINVDIFIYNINFSQLLSAGSYIKLTIQSCYNALLTSRKRCLDNRAFTCWRKHFCNDAIL